MHPYPICSVGAVGVTVTSGGSSAETAIPNDATANDIMVGPGDGIFLHVQGFTHIAYIQQAAGSKVNIIPIEA